MKKNNRRQGWPPRRDAAEPARREALALAFAGSADAPSPSSPLSGPELRRIVAGVMG